MQQNKPGNEILSTSSISNLNQSQNSSSLSPSLPATAAATMTTSNAITTNTSDGNTASTETATTAPTVASTTTTTTTAAAGTASSSSSVRSSGGGAFDTKWIFPADKIINSPSRADGISYEDELTQRQESALFITDLGHMLKRNQLAINTAIIYMHRFYMVHSFKKFQRYVRMVASACLFFACKVEEQPLRLREFIEAIHSLLHKANHPHAYSDQDMRKYGDEIVALESCLIQTLGFNVCINHAHTIIIKTCQMIKAPRDLAEAAYLTATNSLMLTDFCVKFSPEKVACFCIYLACKWTGMIIPTSSEGFQWYQYVQANMTELELEDASKEYVEIYDKCPPRVHRKLGRYKEKNEPSEANESSSASTTASVSSGTPGPRPTAAQQQAIKQEPQVPSMSGAPPASTGSSSSSSSHNASSHPPASTHSSSGHSRPHHQPYPHPNQSQYHSNHHPPHHNQNQHHYQQPHRGHQSGRPPHSGPAGSRHPPPPGGGSHHHSSLHHHQQQQPTSREFSQD